MGLQTLPPLRNLSQLAPLTRTAAASPEMAGDQVRLSRPHTSQPAEVAQKPSSSWMKRTLFGAGLTAMAVTGAMAGGSPAMAATQANSAQVKVIKQEAKAAPTTLLQQQHLPTHLLTARVGVTPSVHDVGPRGKIESDQRIESKPGAQGQQLTHNVRIDRLSRASDGHVLYHSESAELGTLNFHDQAKSDWKTKSVVQGAGHYGKFISVSETTTRSTGGAERTSVKLRTLDSRTGNVINLSELVSSEDYVKMAETIAAGVNNPAGQHYQQPDMESWDHHMNNGFSLREAKDGSVILTVAIPSNSRADAGKVAEFSFSLPASALLLK